MRDTRAEGFLQAIRDNLDADDVRLIYADWLDDHGDPARAEFIRVQCEKARLPRWHRRWSQLAWRERVLLARHERAWRAELPVLLGVEWGEFERGFVAEVKGSDPARLEEQAETLRGASPVQRFTFTSDFAVVPDVPGSLLLTLDLSGSYGEDELFGSLGSVDLSNVSSLYLDGRSMGNGNLRPLLENGTVSNLTRLRLKGSSGYLEDARIRPPDVALLAQSRNLARLTALDLSGNELDTISLCALLKSPHLSRLRELNVSSNRLTAALDLLAGIANGPRLHSLNLSVNSIGDRGAAALANSSFCAELVNLDLERCDVTSTGVRALASASWARGLGRLNLNHNSAGSEGTHGLRAVLGCGALSALHLRNNALDAEAIKLLAESDEASALEILDLSENPLDAESVQALASSTKFTRLREFHLERSQINGETLEVLLRAPWVARLAGLWLSHNPIGDRGFHALVNSTALGQLNELSLANCGLGPASVALLPPALLPELHWLDLSRNHLGYPGAESIARSSLPASLVELNLNGNNVTDQGASRLAAAAWPLLSELLLGSNGLTEAGVGTLAEAATLRGVRRFRIYGNRIPYNAERKLDPRFRLW